MDVADQFWQLNMTGERLRNSGDYAAAERHYLTALELAPQLPADDVRIAIVLDNLGTSYAQTDRYDIAIDKHLEALRILQRSHPDHVRDLAITNNNLGLAYLLLGGRYQEARDYLMKARDFYQRLAPFRDMWTLNSYIANIINLASTEPYLGQGPAAARQWLAEALELCRQYEQANPGHNTLPFQANAELMEANLLLDDGELDAAAPLIDRALAAFSQRSGWTSEDTLNARLAKARVLWQRGDPAAEQTLLDLIGDMVANNGKSDRLEQARSGLAAVYRASGRVGEEAEQLVDNMNSEEVRTSQRLRYGSRREQINDVCDGQDRFTEFMSLLFRAAADHPELAGIGLEHWLRRKGAAADVLRAFDEQDTSTPATDAQRELAALRDALAEDIRRSSPLIIQEHEAAQARKARMAATRAKIEDLERSAVGARLDGIGLLRSGLVEELTRVLPDATVLLEFCSLAVRHEKGEERGAPAYGVFVAGHQGQRVRFSELGAHEKIEQLVANTLTEITAHDAVRGVSLNTDELPADDFTQATNDSLQAFAAAVEALIPPGTKRLIVSADAELCGLPFALLPRADGTRWLDAFAISHVSSGAELITPRRAATATVGSSVVVAAPKFSTAGRTAPYGDLDGARAEGQEVATRLGVQAQLGPAARRDAVLGAAQPDVLHLATHGFYTQRPPYGIVLTRAPAAQGDDDAAPVVIANIGDPSQPLELDQELVMGGLAFAGANDAAYERDHDLPADDCELFAADIGKMDLSSTELVVLSACDTGRGTAVAAQGLWGLPLALQTAGAQAIVVSLWQVNDASTTLLMTRFYDRLCAGDTKTEALRCAARAVRDAYPHPRFWAPFIALGSDAPLRRFALAPTLSARLRREATLTPWARGMGLHGFDLCVGQVLGGTEDAEAGVGDHRSTWSCSLLPGSGEAICEPRPRAEVAVINP
jgi:CHAT domain-containing protein